MDDGGVGVVGVDEAGRGPIAGPVVAAAVVAEAGAVFALEGVVDSKKLSEKQREYVYATLTSSEFIRYHVQVVERERIDDVNILRASHEAMVACVRRLDAEQRIGAVYVDGNLLPRELADDRRCTAVIKGDSKVFAIAAASIIAKVWRDRIMKAMSEKYPQYGFESHKGYYTKRHRQALLDHGPCAEHRRSFRPIKNDEWRLLAKG